MYKTDRIYDHKDAMRALGNDGSMASYGFSVRARWKAMRGRAAFAEKEESTGKWRFMFADLSAVIWEPKTTVSGSESVYVHLGFPYDEVKADSSVRFDFLSPPLDFDPEEYVC